VSIRYIPTKFRNYYFENGFLIELKINLGDFQNNWLSN